MLQVRGLHKSYGDVVALAGVDLDAARGQVVGLLGPNGAGKTTLVSIVAGLRKADAGGVRVGDVDALAHPERARELIGLAPQELGIYPIVSVRHNLRLFGELSGLRGAQLKERIDEVAERLGLTDLLGRLGGQLSGGEKRRLHTAIALLHEPPLLLLDEATVGADVRTRAAVLDMVRTLASEGAAIVYSTHYLHEIEQLHADVVILDRGEVIAKGGVDDLIERHATAAVELTFDGPAPAISAAGEVTVDGSQVRIATQDTSATIGHVLDTIGDARTRLRGIEVIHPSLESVYLQLTGRRFVVEEPNTEGAIGEEAVDARA